MYRLHPKCHLVPQSALRCTNRANNIIWYSRGSCEVQWPEAVLEKAALSLTECLPERQQREERHLEMLEAERDPDDRDAAD